MRGPGNGAFCGRCAKAVRDYLEEHPEHRGASVELLSDRCRVTTEAGEVCPTGHR